MSKCIRHHQPIWLPFQAIASIDGLLRHSLPFSIRKNPSLRSTIQVTGHVRHLPEVQHVKSTLRTSMKDLVVPRRSPHHRQCFQAPEPKIQTNTRPSGIHRHPSPRSIIRRSAIAAHVPPTNYSQQKPPSGVFPNSSPSKSSSPVPRLFA